MKRAAGFLLLAAAVTACGTPGSGVMAEEQRVVAEFTRVDVRDGLNVELRLGSAVDGEVIVRFDDNLLDHIRTEVEGETLVVD